MQSPDMFRDRRPSGHLPKPEDFETPLTRTAIAEANRRFRESGARRAAGTDPARADRLIRRMTKGRFNARREGAGDFETVGDYLAYMNGLTNGD